LNDGSGSVFYLVLQISFSGIITPPSGLDDSRSFASQFATPLHGNGERLLPSPHALQDNYIKQLKLIDKTVEKGPPGRLNRDGLVANLLKTASQNKSSD
jgi:hypothetical protein